MALEIVKTTKLVGKMNVDNNLVKEVTVDIDEKGVSRVNEYIYNETLYAENRREMRKQEKEFREKRYEIEDAILAELESKGEERE